MLKTYMPEDWYDFLELKSDRFAALEACIEKKYSEGYSEGSTEGTVFPPKHNVFRAFDLCALQSTKVIILGQDPYHTPGQADGLAFSCGISDILQPSVRNIFKEVERDMGKVITEHGLKRGCLEFWADQGVLLINSVMTVEQGKPRSHIGLGWEEFTAHVINHLLTTRKNLVFMRWGNDAKAFKLPFGTTRNHLILDSSHPSPLGYHYSFKECQHFKQCNAYLKKHGKTEIDWTG